MYTEDQLIQLSGIQHIAFCPRQFALAYIEMQWENNALTVEGNYLHKKVDDPMQSDALTPGSSRTAVLRAVPLCSYRLGLSGTADVVELRPHPAGMVAKGHPGRWMPYPIEYKRGKPKHGHCDQVQLCAQALCLEEMYNIQIPEGALFYGEIRRRDCIAFTAGLRAETEALAAEMHRLWEAKQTPRAAYRAACKSCSLYSLCLPKQIGAADRSSSYLQTLYKPDF